MRFFLILVILSVFSSKIFAQVPYFAGTAGDNKLYGYTSLKFRPGKNAQETYTTFQYGIGNSFAAGVDLSTNMDTGYAGCLIRYGVKINPWFNIGLQLTPSFDLSNNLKFSYVTNALYINGVFTPKKDLFWVSNTWYGINKGSENTLSQWLYLGYSIHLKNGDSLTPMAGTIYSWKFDADADIALGFYYSRKSYNFYLWGNDLLKSHPRMVIGVDFNI